MKSLKELQDACLARGLKQAGITKQGVVAMADPNHVKETVWLIQVVVPDEWIATVKVEL